MKKIFGLIVLAVLLNCHVALAESIPVVGGDGAFLFWCTASVADIQKKIDCCKEKVITQNEYGNTALMWVANCTENKTIIDMLIKAGSNVNEQNKYNGMTALMRSMGNSDPEITRYLIQSGAKLNTKDKEGRTALMHAEDIKMIETLIQSGADVNIKDKDGKTALMDAVKHKSPDVVKMLIKAGADVNVKNDDKVTALMIAAEYSSPEIVKLLIDAGADVNVKDKDGWTALTLAQNPEIRNTLIKAGADVKTQKPHFNEKSALLNAVQKNASPKIIQELINVGEDVNAKDREGKTVLMYAALNGKPDIVKMLISAGADVNAKTRNGMTAWRWSRYSNPEVKKILEEAGAQIPKAPTPKGKIRETVEQIAVGVIAVPIVLVGATVYSVTHGTSFDKGLGCVLTAGLVCGSW